MLPDLPKTVAPSAVLENRFEDCSDILMSKPIKTKFDETFTLSCFLYAFAVPWFCIF